MREEGYITDKNNSCEYIRLAVKSDICAIRKIWRNIFTPDEDYLNVIFNNLYPLLDAFVCTIDEKVASVAFAIPITLVQRNVNGSSLPKGTPYYGRYLYGVATTEEARGRGLSRKLVKHIKEHYTATGEEFIITRPAEESLFPFYKSQGFTLPLYRREITIDLNPTFESSKSHDKSRETIESNRDISAKKLQRLRAELDQNIFKWSSPILECILKLLKVEKSIIRHFPESDKYFIASCYPQEDQRKLIIQENNFSSLRELLSDIHKTEISTICPYPTEISNIYPHPTDVDKMVLIEIILPFKSSKERVQIDFENKIIKESISEFALCMPLSSNITDELIKSSFFNFTME